jgi:hypothetical protein
MSDHHGVAAGARAGRPGREEEKEMPMLATPARTVCRVLAAIALPAALLCAGGAGPWDHDHWDHGHWGHDHFSFGLVIGAQPVRTVYYGPGTVYVTQPPVVVAPPVYVAPAPVYVPQQSAASGQPPVVLSQQPPAATPSYPDVVPAQLGFAAYQSQGTIIVVVTGANNCASYTTSLTSVDATSWSPSLLMRNTPTGAERAGEASAPFSITAALHVTHAVSAISIKIADKTYQVPVTEAPSLS